MKIPRSKLPNWNYVEHAFKSHLPFKFQLIPFKFECKMIISHFKQSTQLFGHWVVTRHKGPANEDLQLRRTHSFCVRVLLNWPCTVNCWKSRMNFKFQQAVDTYFFIYFCCFHYFVKMICFRNFYLTCLH